MFAFIDWYIKLLTAVLGWGSFLFVGLWVVAIVVGGCNLLAGNTVLITRRGVDYKSAV